MNAESPPHQWGTPDQTVAVQRTNHKQITTTSYGDLHPRALTERTPDYCNVIVRPSGRSERHERGCLLPVSGTAEDGSHRCAAHLREDELRLEWLDRVRSAEANGARVCDQFAAMGHRVGYDVHTGGQLGDPTLSFWADEETARAAVAALEALRDGS